MAWYNCSDCVYMNLKDKNKYGEAYCCERHHYYNPGDTACNKAKIKGRNGEVREVGKAPNCYITTAVCDILGYDDNCNAMMLLRKLRDTYMKKEVDCFCMLREYDLIGPIIADNLDKDPSREVMAKTLFNQFITPSTLCIVKGDYEMAIDKYIEMTNLLKDHYNIDLSYDEDCAEKEIREFHRIRKQI